MTSSSSQDTNVANSLSIENTASTNSLDRDQTSSELLHMPFTAHVVALRGHLIKILALVIGLFLLLLPMRNVTYQWLSAPLRDQLPVSSTMIATDVTATFMAPFKLNLFVAVFLAVPFIIYQLWLFIRPALYLQEQRLAFPIIFGSIVLFYAGVAFAYFITLPAILHFFIHASPDTVAPMTDVSSYLTFCLKLFMVFGVTFEIPIVTLVLILAGIVTVESLAQKRRYIIVGCFFIAMFVTPPDALSMIMLAVPMWLLFELGLVAGRLLHRG